MRSDELPDDINDLPLDDPELAAGVIDLCLGYGDRLADSLLVLPCDERGVSLRMPVVVAGVPWDADEAGRRRGTGFLTEVPLPGVVVALSSAGRLRPTIVERWRRTIERRLESCGTTLVAFGVADARTDTVEIVGGLAGAAAA